MISLRNGYMTSLLPQNLGGQPEVLAFAYALHKQVEKLMDLTESSMVYSNLQSVPESVLDYLAVELRTPCYDMAETVDVKRELILQTMPYYMMRGTTYMVNTILSTLFGDSHIKEFWECALPPHYFKLHVRGSAATSRPSSEFCAVLDQIKRKSQWLAAIEMEFDTMQHTLGVCGVMGSILTTPVREAEDKFDFVGTLYMGGAVSTITASPIQERPDPLDLRAELRMGSGWGTITKTPIKAI